MTTTKGTCATCKFSGTNTDGQLHCYRRSPQVSMIPQQGRHPITGQPHLNIRTLGFWPPVNSDEGCWEWESQLVLS